MSEHAGLVKISVDLAFRRANIKTKPPNAKVALMSIAGAEVKGAHSGWHPM